jgi:glycosyltransferase involved in cell wall biosynthesis
MEQRREIDVELVEHSPGAPFSGIGRYTRDLYSHLVPYISARLVTHVDPPLTRYVSFLHHLPLGVQPHRAGTIVHFVEDMGCSQMLWRPVRPAIATSHDLGMLVWPPEAKMHRSLDRLLLYLSYLGLKRMDAVVTVSEFSRQMLIKQLRAPAERVFTVYSGIDHAIFKPVAGAREKLAERCGLPDGTSDRFLLYVGTEIPRKNLVTLLKALGQLPVNIRLLKVGPPGPRRFREATKKVIEQLNLTDRVLFFEQVSDDDLALLYNVADAYVCCSFLEGFGHPVLEAMACGTPVICSNVAALPEITGGAAILVPPDDDKAYAEAILTVLSDHTLHEQLSTQGQQRAAAFTWERTAESVVAVYQEVITGHLRTGMDGRRN